MADAYVVYKKTSDDKYYLASIASDDSVTAIAELAELSVLRAPGNTKGETLLVRILMDNDENVYCMMQENLIYDVPYGTILYKYNSSGVLQTSKVLLDPDLSESTTHMFGFTASDGYLYTMHYNGDTIYKRGLSDLETIETISLTSGHKFYYLCLDSDGYIYTYDKDYTGEAAFIKWEVDVGISEFHQQGFSSMSAWTDFSLLGNNIAHDNFGDSGRMGIIAASLDADMVYWAMDDIPAGQACGVVSNATYWYVLGENTADDTLIVEKYNSSKVLQSTIEVTSDYVAGSYRRFFNAIASFPVSVSATYDYPLYPVIFPLET